MKKINNSDLANVKAAEKEQALWTFIVAVGMVLAAFLQMKHSDSPLAALLDPSGLPESASSVEIPVEMAPVRFQPDVPNELARSPAATGIRISPGSASRTR